MKDALIKKLEGDIAKHEANVATYLSKPAYAIAEHIDYITPVEKELEKLSSTKGKLVSLKNIKFKLDE